MSAEIQPVTRLTRGRGGTDQERIQRGCTRPPLFELNSLKSPLNRPKYLGGEPQNPLRPLLFEILDLPLQIEASLSINTLTSHISLWLIILTIVTSTRTIYMYMPLATSPYAVWRLLTLVLLHPNIYGFKHILKVIYHPLYGMNNYVLIWGDWLSCDPLRASHDSQSTHIRKHLCPIVWQL